MDDPEIAAKAVLRRRFRNTRNVFVDGLAVGQRERLESELAAVVTPLLGGHNIIATYAAVGPEIDPRAIEVMIPQMIAFPRVTGRAMAFHAATWANLTPRTLGIPEPDAGAPEVIPSLLLVPLLAVTLAGVRLGQGGGYYDRMLRSLRAAGPISAIGLAWNGQITDDLPRDPWDELLDWVATPTRLVDCRKGR